MALNVWDCDAPLLSFLKQEETRLVKLHRRPRWKRILYAPIHFWKVLRIGKEHIPRVCRVYVAWLSTIGLCKRRQSSDQ